MQKYRGIYVQEVIGKRWQPLRLQAIVSIFYLLSLLPLYVRLCAECMLNLKVTQIVDRLFPLPGKALKALGRTAMDRLIGVRQT